MVQKVHFYAMLGYIQGHESHGTKEADAHKLCDDKTHMLTQFL